MILTEDDFLGRWRLTREITDFRMLENGTLEGEARFTQHVGGLLYHERGTLQFAGGAPLTAERRYIWSFDGGQVAVSYDDGTMFHSFAPKGSGPTTPHLCGEDMYRGNYSFVAFPKWQVTWNVEGPRKNYRSVTQYCRN